MSVGTLYTTPQNVDGQRILAVAALGGLKIDLAPNFKGNVDNKKPEFLAKFPNGKIPAFEGKDGFTIFNTSAIARYVATLAPHANLLGTNPQETALIDQWVMFADADVALHTVSVARMYSYVLHYNQPLEQAHLIHLDEALEVLDKHLSTHKYIVGDHITVADVHVASILVEPYKNLFDASARARFSHITRHFEYIINQPLIKPIFGEVVYAEKAQRYVAPAKPKEV